MNRPDWDSYFLGIAAQVATRSTCDRAHVGCVLVRDKRILTTGFNGSPSGMPHCDDVGHLMIGQHCERTIHAEMNAVIQCALHGISCRGATAYITHYPCFGCAKALINAGIKRVVYQMAYNPSTYSIKWLEDSGIEVVRIDTWTQANFSLEVPEQATLISQPNSS